MKTLKTDSFGVLSEKNSMSKYWGVSVAKNGQGFTVRFQDSVSKDTINFKPKSLLSEYVASVIARGFYEDRNLYSNSIEFVVNTKEGDYIVNCCANTIKLVDDANDPSVETYENAKPVVKKALKEREESSNPIEEVKSAIVEEKVEESSAKEEVETARDIVAELREIRRQTRLIGKRIERLAQALKEAA